MVQRQIDEIPSRSELQQYQLQLMELYDQIAVKLTETRKYFQTYNALDDTQTFLTKEISILNSVYDNYRPAMKSEKSKEKLLEQLKVIISSVEANLDKVVDLHPNLSLLIALN